VTRNKFRIALLASAITAVAMLVGTKHGGGLVGGCLPHLGIRCYPLL
jgi:hypothetical protein